MYEEFERIWCDFVDFRTRFTHELHFKDQHSQFVMAYWARVNALCAEIMVLIQNCCYTSVPIVMRSSLESLVEQRCLINDSSYLERIIAAESESEYKHLKQYSESNPYYMGSSPISPESLAKLNSSKRGLGIADRFKKAQCEELYSTVYNQLCRHAHGNITALASRNFENDKIVLSATIKENELIFLLSSTINTAVISTHDLLEFYQLDETHLKGCLDFNYRVKVLCKKFE